MMRKDAKPRFSRWLLFFQEFDFEVKNQTGLKTKWQTAYHDYWVNTKVERWYWHWWHISIWANIGCFTRLNSMICRFHQLLSERCDTIKLILLAVEEVYVCCIKFIWDDPYLFWICAYRIIHRYIPEVNIMKILEVCHLSLIVWGGRGFIILVVRQTIILCNMGTIGQPLINILMTIQVHMTNAKEKWVYQESMNFFSPSFLWLSFLMFGVLSLWVYLWDWMRWIYTCSCWLCVQMRWGVCTSK